MFNEERVGEILEGIAWLNGQMGVWSFIVPIMFAVGVLWLLFINYRQPSRRHAGYLLSFYAFIYLFSGYTIYLGKDFMGLKVALAGAIGLWFVALFLILDVIFNWTTIKVPEQKSLKIFSWLLIFTGIFLYPLVEISLGFTYPGMVFFGAECPTTISLIGLYIGSIPKVNKPLFVIISLNAIVTGGSVALSGATFDYLYALAGIIGMMMLILHFKEIFLKPRVQS